MKDNGNKTFRTAFLLALLALLLLYFIFCGPRLLSGSDVKKYRVTLIFKGTDDAGANWVQPIFSPMLEVKELPNKETNIKPLPIQKGSTVTCSAFPVVKDVVTVGGENYVVHMTRFYCDGRYYDVVGIAFAKE